MKKNGITVSAMAIVLFGLTLLSIFLPKKDFSESERRPLAEYPKITWESVLSGDFVRNFEKASLDRFPARNAFRTIKAVSSYYVFRRLDNNKIYLHDGYAAKLEYPMNESSLDYAIARFKGLYDKYMAGTDVKLYFSVIPDKSRFLAAENGYLSMDYDAFIKKMRKGTDYMTYIDIMNDLSIEDYYKTDTHWRQERLTGVANALAFAMGSSVSGDYTEKLLDVPFYGVYYGQSALPLPPEKMYYLTSDMMDSFTVTVYDAAKPYRSEVYDMEKAHGKDPYEMFLSGSVSLLTIDNENAKTEKELIIFRDSFGSSIAPLLAEGYKKVTLVDIRYLSSDLVGRFLKFENQDVLFLYSTIVLNNSITMK